MTLRTGRPRAQRFAHRLERYVLPKLVLIIHLSGRRTQAPDCPLVFAGGVYACPWRVASHLGPCRWIVRVQLVWQIPFCDMFFFSTFLPFECLLQFRKHPDFLLSIERASFPVQAAEHWRLANIISARPNRIDLADAQDVIEYDQLIKIGIELLADS